MVSGQHSENRDWTSVLCLIILLLATDCCAQNACRLITDGGLLLRSVTLSAADSPCVIQKNLIVAEKYTLTLNAGVELRFNPGMMLAVNGTLLIKVSELTFSSLSVGL